MFDLKFLYTVVWNGILSIHFLFDVYWWIMKKIRINVLAHVHNAGFLCLDTFSFDV